MSKYLAVFFGILLLCVSVAQGQGNKKVQDQTRSVQGVVTTPDETPANGAVVYLKNTKTLQIRSFITKENGTYYFHGLSPDIDYEVSAESKSQGLSSPARTLSSFDSRKEAVINLKLSKKS